MYTLYEKGGNMSYGIEVYNSNQDLIFSSEKNPVQILKFSSITLNNPGDEVTINFPETSSKPKIWVENSSQFYIVPSSGGLARLFHICFKNIEKNINGNYSSFTICAYILASLNIDTRQVYEFPWEINYIVFV